MTKQTKRVLTKKLNTLNQNQRSALKGIIKTLETWAKNTPFVDGAGKRAIKQNLQNITNLVESAYPTQ